MARAFRCAAHEKEESAGMRIDELPDMSDIIKPGFIESPSSGSAGNLTETRD
jgi:hypothetical protein